MGPAGGKNGSTFLNTTTVTAPADTTADNLTGGTGLDWFLAQASDQVTKTSNETLTILT
jgi:hypothetical protein